MTATESFFDALKQHRESQNIEISEICDFTKINPKYIHAIESGEFHILPTVYMRLFLRAYADFIGADSVKALEDYELHTIGTIQKRTDFDLPPKVEIDNSGIVEETMESSAQISPKQIATGAAVLIGLFLVLYWAGEITSQQNIEVENNPAPIEEIAPEFPPVQEPESIPADDTDSDGSAEKKSPLIEKLVPFDPSTSLRVESDEGEQTPSVASTSPATKNIPNKFPLNSNDFLPENKDRETTSILKLFAPYIITITTLKETKLNISKSNDGDITELINQVSPPGMEYQFDFESTINFEFWSNAHIKVKLNEIPLDNFLSDDGFSVRGSYEADKSQLYLGFYRH